MAETAPKIDFLDVHFYLDPYPAYTWLRRHAPVYWHEENHLWSVTLHEDLIFVSTHPDIFCSGEGYRPGMGADPSLISLDPPRHTQLRRLINKGFTPRMVAQMESHIRELVVRTIDHVAPRGRCDFVQDIAVPIPMLVTAELLGLPHEDWRSLQRWSDDMTIGDASHPLDKTILAYQEYCDYFARHEAAKRAHPKDDLISQLIDAEIEGERLDYDDVLRTALLLLVGGNETTRNTVTGGMQALIAHPAQLVQLVAEPARIPQAVEEFLRWVTPIMNFRRTATRDYALRGQKIRAGEQVLMLHGSANRDESVFPDAASFDITREPNPHLAFGIGTHFCLGANLARLEMRIIFEELLARLPDMHLAPDAVAERSLSTFIRGWTSMPVEYTPA